MMKNIKNIFAVALTLVLLSVMLCLSACGGMTLKESGGMGAVDKESGVVWKHASTCYEAITLGDKVGKLKVTDKQSLDLHEIEDMDAASWLATEEGHVLYAEGTHLPTLPEMKPTAMLVCVENETTKVLCNVQEAEKINAVVAAFSEGESVTYPAKGILRTYRVRFTSPDYAGMYYTLTYVEYADDYVLDNVNHGKYFLYNAFDQIFVPVGEEIHAALGLD